MWAIKGRQTDKGTWWAYPALRNKRIWYLCYTLRLYSSWRGAYDLLHRSRCVVDAARDFDPISSSCHPCVDGWTWDPILGHIGTIPSEPIAGAKRFLLLENCILCPLLLKCAVSVIVMSVTEYHKRARMRDSPELYIHNVQCSTGKG
jgi:hypothetical protein